MSEKSEAKRLDARLHKNSGRGQKKGDASWLGFVVDFKEASKSFSLNKKVWAKVCTDAAKVDIEKHPLLAIILGERDKVRLGLVDLDVLEHREQFYQKHKHLEEE